MLSLETGLFQFNINIELTFVPIFHQHKIYIHNKYYVDLVPYSALVLNASVTATIMQICNSAYKKCQQPAVQPTMPSLY